MKFFSLRNKCPCQTKQSFYYWIICIRVSIRMNNKAYIQILLAQYLYGKKFDLYTDHKALIYMHSQKERNEMLTRWHQLLLEFDPPTPHAPHNHSPVSSHKPIYPHPCPQTSRTNIEDANNSETTTKLHPLTDPLPSLKENTPPPHPSPPPSPVPSARHNRNSSQLKLTNFMYIPESQSKKRPASSPLTKPITTENYPSHRAKPPPIIPQPSNSLPLLEEWNKDD